MPQWRPGRPNMPASSDLARPLQPTRSQCDDENTGVNPQPLGFRSPNVRVLTGDEDRAGFELLPLCRLEKSERAEATPKLAAASSRPCSRAMPGPPSRTTSCNGLLPAEQEDRGAGRASHVARHLFRQPFAGRCQRMQQLIAHERGALGPLPPRLRAGRPSAGRLSRTLPAGRSTRRSSAPMPARPTCRATTTTTWAAASGS